MAAKGYNFSRLEKMAQNRVRWKHIVDGQCSTLEKRAMMMMMISLARPSYLQRYLEAHSKVYRGFERCSEVSRGVYRCTGVSRGV